MKLLTLPRRLLCLIDRAEDALKRALGRYFPAVWFVLISVLALALRLAMFDHESGDARVFLLPWYEAIREGGGFAALAEQTGNYTILYQAFIALITYLPIEPLHAYKALSCLFDWLLAFSLGRIAYDSAERDAAICGLAVYAAALFSPIVFLNSACWAQCDSIWAFFCVASLGAFAREKYFRAFILYGLAFAVKLQAVFLMPFFLFAWLQSDRVRLRHFLLIPASVAASGLPGLVFGRRLWDVFSVYVTQTGYYTHIALNYPSFWLIAEEYDLSGAYSLFRYAAILLTVGLLAAHMLLWQRAKLPLTRENVVRMAFLLCYTCVLFLPAMHERYGFLYEALALLIACFDRRTVILLVPLQLVTLTTYGAFLFGRSPGLRTAAWLNCALYLLYSIYLTRRMRAAVPPADTSE